MLLFITFIQNYKTNWKQCVRKIKNKRIPKQIIEGDRFEKASEDMA
jgi:hypothetical protein